MTRADRIAAFLLLVLLGCFAAGIWELFTLRFETGDSFPAYSSLRSDPLGVKAFFQALEKMPETSVERLYRPLSKLAGKGKTTLFYLGLSPNFLTSHRTADVDQLETLAKDGARIVLAFRPGQKKTHSRIVAVPPTEEQHSPEEDSQKPDTAQVKEDKENTQETNESKKPAGERWGIKPDYFSIPVAGEQGKSLASLNGRVDSLPKVFPLHSAFCFKDLGREWRVLYKVGDCSVIVERALGDGSIVLVADSYLFSNEAMLKERNPGLLSWLAGNCRLIVFDEFHLGVGERPGVMTLLRKYRLHGFSAVLLLLAGLFAWQNLVRFIPENAGGEDKNTFASSDLEQSDGLINVIQRNIKTDVLLKTCFAEWEESIGRDRGGMEERIRQARDIVQDAEGKGSPRDLAAAYKEVSRILSDRTHK